MHSNIWRFLAYLRPYRRRMARAFFMMALTTGITFIPPYLYRLLIDQLPTAPVAMGAKVLLSCVSGLLTLTLFGSLIHVLQQYDLLFVGQRLLFDVRQTLFRHIQKLSLRYYESRQTGYIYSRVMYDVDMVQSIATSWVNQLIADLLTLVVAVAVLLSFNWKLALVAFAGPPLYLVNYLVFHGPIRWASLDWGFKISEMAGNLYEKLSGVREVKSFGKERVETRRFITDMRESLEFNLRLSMLSTVLWQVASAIAGTATILIWLIGGYSVLRHTGMTVGGIQQFISYTGLLYGPLLRISQAAQTLQSARAAIDRIFETLDTMPDVQEKPDAITLPHVRGRIEFEHVDFSYDPDRPVLKDMSFAADPGAVTALVGPSGGGKSTVINLIPRFYDPQGGSITLDGTELRDLKLNFLRQQIGIVLQETFLFGGTVRENIRYGRENASDEDIVAAATAANAHEFILELKHGYESEIGERGARLSGGQKQRIAIARAILRNPRILILDEATSSLDSEAEAEIQAALDHLMKDRTTFVIAHRLSTVMHADQILVIEEGKIIERGTHDELVAAGGRYAHLCEIQFKRASERRAAV
jgi:subfamily B ATP-binding cassette protein MsbA